MKKTIKKRGKPKSLKSYRFGCDCCFEKKCGVLVISDFRDGDACLDIFLKKKCLGGVYLNDKHLQKLIKLLIKINN